MGYVIAAILVLLVVAAGVTFFVLRATRPGRESPASIVAPDDRTPLGDTDQLSGEQASEGRPVTGGEAEGGGPVEPESERLANRRR